MFLRLTSVVMMIATSKQISRQILTILEETILQTEIMETALTKMMHQAEIDDEKGAYYIKVPPFIWP